MILTLGCGVEKAKRRRLHHLNTLLADWLDSSVSLGLVSLRLLYSVVGTEFDFCIGLV